ncbi:MAG: type II toxin-antitoxin system PemK/MazF family toxin [Campylobacteraceae bacterium]|jgi:mRNA interferase MazF|nr:type II toxin-antitoxin system PemK/MazF family toxin [Campylobacteraceae bacterium]
MKQGDIIMIDFNPTKGHEQAGYRPAVIVSNNVYNKKSKLLLVCPITNTIRDFPFYVKLENTQTTGIIMCDQIKAIDGTARNIKFVEKLPVKLLQEVIDIIQGSIEIL